MPTTYYEWDELDDVIVAERDENGSTIVEYTHEPGYHGQLISQRRNGHSYFYHYDPDGNTTALTDENGDVTDTYSYTAFGEVTERTGTTENPFQFRGAHGYYLDSFTGQYMTSGANYDPTRGRWLSANLLASLAQEMNLYSFFANAIEGPSPSNGQMYVGGEGQDPATERDAEGTGDEKCECGEDKITISLVKLYQAIRDVELFENVDSNIDVRKTKEFARVPSPVDVGKGTVRVLLDVDQFRVVCCKRDKETRVIVKEDLKRPLVLAENTTVPKPPGPPTRGTMKKVAKCAFPVPYLFFQKAEADHSTCLQKAFPKTYIGPVGIIKKNTDLDACGS